jgi:hypothetical protein
MLSTIIRGRVQDAVVWMGFYRLSGFYYPYIYRRMSLYRPLDILTCNNSGDTARLLLWNCNLVLLHHHNHVLIGLFSFHEERIVSTTTGKDENEQGNNQPQGTTTNGDSRESVYANIALSLGDIEMMIRVFIASVNAVGCGTTVVVVVVINGLLAKRISTSHQNDNAHYHRAYTRDEGENASRNQATSLHAATV